MAATRMNVTSAGRTSAENSTSAQFAPTTHGQELYFAEFVILPDEGRLLHNGSDVPLAPKPFETLLYLVRHAGHVVSKQDLLEAVWPGTFISDDGLVQCVVDIRRALGDSARSPRFIQTLPKRGYRFLVPASSGSDQGQTGVRLGSDQGQTGVRLGSDEGQTSPSRPERPSIGRLLSSVRPAGWVAAVVIVLLATAAAVFLTTRTPSTVHPYAPESGLVVMLPMQMVEGLDDLGWLRTGAIDVVAAEITRWQGARLVPRHRVEAAIVQAGLAQTPVVPLDRGLAIARELRGERLVTGSIQRVNERFVVQASILEVRSGQKQRDVAVHGERRADLPDALARFSHQLGEALGTPAPAAAGAAAVPIATKSLDAYRAYTEALEREGRGGREESAEAEARLQDAIRHDPTFAAAYVRLALVQQARRRWTYGESDPAPAVRAARQRAAELPERERLLVNGLAYLLLDKKPARALEAWGALLRLYPAFSQESGVPTLIADTLMQQGRWAELILETEPHVDAAAVPVSERALLHSLLGKAFRKQGEFDRAIAHATRASDLWPSREGPALLRVRTLLGRTLVDAGRADEAVVVFRQIATDARADVINVADAGWGLYMAGRHDEARALADRAIALDASYGNAYHLRGWLQLTGGDPAQAARSFEQAYERTPAGFGVPEQGLVLGDTAALYYAAIAHARAGDSAAASRVWRRMYDTCRAASASRHASDVAPTIRWHVAHCVALAAARLGIDAPDPGRLEGDDATYYLLRARLEGARRRPEAAQDALREAIRLRVGDLQHIADDPNFELLSGDPVFRRLVNAGR